MIPLARALRIVVADDEVDIRDYLAVLLPRLGHEVVGSAENGQQLVELCQRERPELVIADVSMPGMSGLEAVDRIAKTRSVPIIIVSSYERNELGNNPLIVDYLLKPFGRSELETAIDRAVHV
jgi:YesN/AraC family two-component response regulator